MSTRPLFDLLSSLFPQNIDLLVYLQNSNWAERKEILASLPSIVVSSKEFKSAVVGQIQTYGLEKRTFDDLPTRFRNKIEEIELARKIYFSPLVTGVGIIGLGLEHVKDKLAQPDVRTALEPSRASLAALANDVEILDVYKGLHDCLHELQMVPMRRLVAAAAMLPSPAASAKLLQLYGKSLKAALARAKGLNQTLEPPQRNAEGAWIGDLGSAVDAYQSALDPEDLPRLRDTLEEIRRILRYQPFRLNKRIYETAHGLPLSALKDALDVIVAAIGTDAPAIEQAVRDMDNLQSLLLTSVDEHKMWQDADNKIWKADEAFESTAPRDAFILIWREAKSSIDPILALDSNADWSDRATEYATVVADRLADEAAEDKDLEKAFNEYETEIRGRFRQVDRSLKADCGALAGIGKSLKDILEGAARANAQH